MKSFEAKKGAQIAVLVVPTVPRPGMPTDKFGTLWLVNGERVPS
ncbi:MAG: hypothetical protein ACREVW_15730 [Burkholderiales bacterium]